MVLVVGGRRYRGGRSFFRRLGALVLLLASLSFASVVRQTLQTHQRIGQLRQELTAQRQRNLDLERALREATDPHQIEQRARATMGLVRPGERVVHPALAVPEEDPFRVTRRPSDR